MKYRYLKVDLEKSFHWLAKKKEQNPIR